MKLTLQTITNSVKSTLQGKPSPGGGERPLEPGELLQSSEFVTEQWYRRKHSVPETMNAVVHYLAVGASKGFDPNPLFRSRWYVAQHNLSREASINPALHYLLVGSKNGLRPNPYFDPNWYRNAYPEVAASGMEPLIHYLQYGAREGRHPGPGVFTQWLPQLLDSETGTIKNQLVAFMDLLDLLKSPQ